MRNAGTPDLSIVIPSYGHAHYLTETLQSFNQQRGINPPEVIVSAVRSDAETLRVLDGWRIKVVLSDEPNVTLQMNAGAAAATGVRMMYFGSDDILLPDILARLMAVSLKTGADVVYPNFWKTNRDLDRRRLVDVGGPFTIEKLREQCFVTDVSLVVRERFMQFLPMKYEHGRERIWRVWLAMAEAGCRFEHFPRPVFLYRQHGGNVHVTGAGLVVPRMGENAGSRVNVCENSAAGI